MVNIHMKLPKVVETLLHDKNVLYIVAFLAIMNFFGYVVLRDSYALLIFLSVGFITTYFSKNMTVVLLLTLLLTNFITVLSRMIVASKEGFDATATTATDATATTATDATATATDATATAAGKPAVATPPVAVKPPVATGIAGAGLGTSGKAPSSKKVATSASLTTMPAQKSNGKVAEAMTELSPASLDDDEDLPVNNRVDYAKTMEKAYDNLENLVGQDGVKGLTSQTNVLMDQQQKLMENMKSMEPLLKTAQSFLDKFESSSMGKLFEKIPGMSSMFGGAAAATSGNVKGAAA
jgi:uncharacterized membrane protein YcgQ (UPF0703/DUF1980 family)